MATDKNEIRKQSIASLGYGFVSPQYLPEGKDEYYLRNAENKNANNYRVLSAYEIEVLVRNRNTAENWSKILVSDAFNPELVKNCKFFGLVRIGKLEPYYLEFSDLKVPVGLYNSTIISSDFGDNVVIENVNYLSHYIIGNDVIITNVNELVTSNYAKFGNGIIKEGEEESRRIWLELCNENGGRKVIPFDGMTTGDAFLWTRFRNDELLMQKFKELTEAKYDKRRGYYGKIGDRTIIKNCKIIKDVWIGSDAYLKGANKLKNITINSAPGAKSQIGEGTEMVNGIMDYGCRAFYGVKAVRFFMASHSQLKYGARLINSYLGNNSTISCCEVLNSLIFPAHEQHHNNSFLCASLLQGQSNIAAGATIGSNHNSRSADGEIIAGRGFWPGLCVSLKHNSKFASFTILSKGDYPLELNIPIPFSLVSNDITNNRITIMPGYWFMYNMYALERNTWKYIDRDRRKIKVQHLEYDYLAPDSINEIVASIPLFECLVGKAWYKKFVPDQHCTNEEFRVKGKELLMAKNKIVDELEVLAEGFENSNRKVVVLKIINSYHLFRELIAYNLAKQVIEFIDRTEDNINVQMFYSFAENCYLNDWINVGGQLIPRFEIELLIKELKNNEIQSWDEIHTFYKKQEEKYLHQKLKHAIAAYETVYQLPLKNFTIQDLKNLLLSTLETKKWMVEKIYSSRAKDYTNPFRKMVYETTDEMDAVVGKLEENSFIKQQQDELKTYEAKVNTMLEKYF